MKDLINIIEKLKINSKTKVHNTNPKDWTIENAEDGDFVACLKDIVFIYNGLNKDIKKYPQFDGDTIIYHACYYGGDKNDPNNEIHIGPTCGVGNIHNTYNFRLATDEQKQEFIDALKSKGYKWDDTKLELEKL